MNSTGRLEDIKRDYADKKVVISFKLDSEVDIEGLQDKELDISVAIHRNKRSLNANSYFHKLCREIAQKTHISITETKNKLIQEYGQFEYGTDGGIQHLIMNDKTDWLKIEWLHLYPTQKTKILDNGEVYRIFLVMRGSHTYNTKEMSVLIDATVQEAKQLGIETLPPDQLERMKAMWKGDAA